MSELVKAVPAHHEISRMRRISVKGFLVRITGQSYFLLSPVFEQVGFQ
jgi:hypothetical protein